MNVKILVIYHKEAPLVKNEVLTPIHVGDMQNNPSAEFLMQNMIGDNTGDNISDKNAVYNEMTAIYWAWKNYDSLGNPDYIGFAHYRRFFIFKQRSKPYYETKNIDDDFYNKVEFSAENLESILKQGDFITPAPSKRRSVINNFKKAHHLEDLLRAVDIIKQKYPEYAEAAAKYLNGSKSYFHNMFIFNKQIFFRYCEWIFNILFEYEKTATKPLDRMFVSERLTGIFFTQLEKEGKKALLLPTLFIAGEKSSLKDAIANTKTNLKAKKSGLLYAFKPLIVFFTPNFILRARRAKT